MLTKSKQIEYLTLEINRLKTENEKLKTKSNKEITKEAQRISNEYIKETKNNLKEIKQLRLKYEILINELEQTKKDYEEQIEKQFGLKKRRGLIAFNLSKIRKK